MKAFIFMRVYLYLQTPHHHTRAQCIPVYQWRMEAPCPGPPPPRFPWKPIPLSSKQKGCPSVPSGPNIPDSVAGEVLWRFVRANALVCPTFAAPCSINLVVVGYCQQATGRINWPHQDRALHTLCR